ncbi:MAG TPA: hypothetical protein VGD41_07020, partial [Pyrinomonadaceae bacterium]
GAKRSEEIEQASCPVISRELTRMSADLAAADCYKCSPASSASTQYRLTGFSPYSFFDSK